MNQEELALYIELQPRLLEFRGSWQVGERCYDQERNAYGVVLSAYKRIDYVDTMNEGVYFQSPDDLIWIPLPIDPADPERIVRGEKPRGLWGMVDWQDWLIDAEPENNIRLHLIGPGLNIGPCSPTLALLKAIKAQWEVKP